MKLYSNTKLPKHEIQIKNRGRIFLLIGILLLCVSCTSNISNYTVAGSVTCNGEPIVGVVITDGYNFVQSSQSGHFELNIDKSARFVSIVTPSGYITDFTDGVPNFYIPLSKEVGSYDFNLRKWGEVDSYQLVAIGDIQTMTQAHFDRFKESAFHDIKNYVEGELDKGIHPVLITVGDITDENFDLYPNYINLMSTLPAPIYPAIGNHDHDTYNSGKSIVVREFNRKLNRSGKGDKTSAHHYNDFFGPEYYAFNLGNDYYIVLDNIIFMTRTYWVSVSKTQQDWMKKYLEFVPKGSNVYICMHAPVMRYGNIIDKSYSEWAPIFKDYNLSIISGHTHVLFNKESIPGLYEHNIGAVCGAWWTANTGIDGAPIGYQIFKSEENNKASWRYKSVGYDLNYQIKLYTNIKDHENSVVVYIWAVDDAWNVEGSFDGDTPIEGLRTIMINPDYDFYFENIGSKLDIPILRPPVTSDSYFIFDIPVGAKRFTIKAIDSFGNNYEESLEL